MNRRMFLIGSAPRPAVWCSLSRLDELIRSARRPSRGARRRRLIGGWVRSAPTMQSPSTSRTSTWARARIRVAMMLAEGT